MEKHLLSKSSVLSGIQCLKMLYLHKYFPDLMDEVSESQQKIFDAGKSVGILAQNLFPGGINASPDEKRNIEKDLCFTEELRNKDTQVIYEAAFQYNQVLVYADIIVKEGDQWSIYEVKSSTSVSETNEFDAAVQYWVISNCGINIKDISIVHINNEYIRLGDLDVHQLFKPVSVKDKALSLQSYITDTINLQKGILSKSEVPYIQIGPHCSNPYMCGFMGNCWQHIPEYSVFDIAGLRDNKKYQLYLDGIINIEDIPCDFPLSKAQQIQVHAHKSGESIIDKAGIKNFLSQVSYPAYFMDFETFNPAVPLFDNSRPYQTIPFQYSLHVKKTKESEPEHFEFLADASGDPRKRFIEKLLNDTEKEGCIIVYNKAFEGRILSELAQSFPEYKLQIEERLDRLVDLMIPFREKLYYTPEMKGSYSIKKVLPALIPSMSYDGMEIGEGQAASNAFEYLFHETNPEIIAGIRRNLLDYCKLDTLATVKILEILENN